jgi:hypothetical protein
MVTAPTPPIDDVPRRVTGGRVHVLVEVVAENPVEGRLWRLDGAPALAVDPPGAARPPAAPFAGWMGLCSALDGVLHAEGADGPGPATGAR